MADKKDKIKIAIIVALFSIAAAYSIIPLFNDDSGTSTSKVAKTKEKVSAPSNKGIVSNINKIKKTESEKKSESKKASSKEKVREALSPLDNPNDADVLTEMFKSDGVINGNPFRVNTTVVNSEIMSNIPRPNELKVSAIGINKDMKVTMVNGSLYQIGDKLFNHYVLSKIDMMRVYITDPTGKVSVLPLY